MIMHEIALPLVADIFIRNVLFEQKNALFNNFSLIIVQNNLFCKLQQALEIEMNLPAKNELLNIYPVFIYVQRS